MKFVPGLPQVFDIWLKLHTYFVRPRVLDRVDEIELELKRWEQVRITAHKYGGLQFNYGDKEIGHIHGNGLLDMLFGRKVKEQLLMDGRVQDHHLFKNSGWISFYIRNAADGAYAIELLELRYSRLRAKPLSK
ncbi:DUF5519 family protein [Mucilaginibacter myungsuensis]|uniref:DUF5519 family protein n=1 Tax=Mucilaginibacter myungsuensis TaxID=649104 RepID=A0A929PXF1_9SPHI|nr:DUF5519 family protein [Mucilaginibacter myungsuensis]